MWGPTNYEDINVLGGVHIDTKYFNISATFDNNADLHRVTALICKTIIANTQTTSRTLANKSIYQPSLFSNH